jgi:hypothetical protein
MSQDAQSLAFIMLFLQAGEKLLALGVVAQEQDGGFGKGLFEVGTADFLSRGAQAFAT